MCVTPLHIKPMAQQPDQSVAFTAVFVELVVTEEGKSPPNHFFFSFAADVL